MSWLTLGVGFLHLNNGGSGAEAQLARDFRASSAEVLAPRVARPAGATLRQLERLESLAKQQAWDELCDVADELLADSNDGWVAVGAGRYIGVREAVHRRLAALPPKGLAAYRQRVDGLAEDWLKPGTESRDAQLLQRIVDQAFCSSAGDDALWALGEIALERGDYKGARAAWRRLRPELAADDALAYPNGSIELADARARLALVSIREADIDQAQREVAEIARRHPDATGRLGGREVNYAARLAELLERARTLPRINPTRGHWPAVFGNPQRTNVSGLAIPAEAEFEQVWSLPTTMPADADMARGIGTMPIATNGLVLFSDSAGIHAVGLENGLREGPSGGAVYRPGKSALLSSTFTADGQRLYAVTTEVSSTPRQNLSSRLIGVDLARGAALVIESQPEAEGAMLVGPPLVCGSRVVVGELAPGQGAKASLACYNAWSGKLAWRRTLGSAAPLNAAHPLSMAAAEDDGVAYVNTNLGMIAAVRVDDGELLWLRTYRRLPRQRDDAGVVARDPRQPNPCMVQGSAVIAAPNDSVEVFALDATTGAGIWSSPLPTADARLLAVDADRVLLTGNRLWSIDRKTGEMDPKWGGELSGGAGQGAVAGELVFWPTAAEILLVDRAGGLPTSKPLALPAIGGAYLAVARLAPNEPEYIVAAGPGHLTAYSRAARDDGDRRDEGAR